MNELVPAAPPLELTATTPVEMQQAQAGLIQWCEQKIASMKGEAAELQESYEVAAKNKWRTATLKRHAELAAKRVTYYEKIKAALEAGYCIVPNFPVTLFAIRTDKTKPATVLRVENYHNRHSSVGYVKTQEAKALEIGEGQYQSPLAPEVSDYKGEITSDSGYKLHQYHTYCEEWGEFEFPINMAKPSIMQATERAMRKLVFDELGILPSPSQKKEDPLIVGRIIVPSPLAIRYRKRITFIIAWHLNVRDL